MATNAANKIYVLCIVSLLFVSSLCVFVAAAPGGANVTLEVDKGQFPLPTPDSVNVTAGNVTQVNLSSTQQTYRWVGLYGNVSGTIKLGNSQSQVLYQWDAVGKYVYASTASTIDWTSIVVATPADVLATFPFLDNGSDNYTLTFDTTGTIDSEVIGLISNVPSSVSLNSTGSPVWPTFSLTDGTNVLFSSQVNSTGDNSFSNETVNYQMIIPEDGLGQNQVATEYFLWVELV